ncbi:MAG: lipase family protein [Opitutales bacterium]
MTPPIFSRLNAHICADLSRILYDSLDSWDAADKPEEGSDSPALTPDLSTLPNIAGNSPLVFRESWARRRKPGPRTRYVEVTESTPGALIAQSEDGTIYIAHRGTKTSKEWDVDSQAVPKTLEVNGNDLGKVHRGFHRTYFSCEAKLKSSLTQLLNDTGITSTSLIITGHSLGAAVSTLHTRAFVPADWGLPSDIPFGALTFASPQPGVESFKNSFEDADEKCRHIINKNDLVPKLPGVAEYCHTGRIMYIDTDFGGPGDNHSMANYKSKIDDLFPA